MEIKDLQARQGNVDLTAEVIEKGDVREFQKFGKAGRVCTAKVKDDTGEITLTLWNDDIDKVNIGDRIQIKNGYVNEWQGEPQLTTGKFGSIEVLESKPSPAESKPKSAKPRARKKAEPVVEEDVEEENVE